MERSVRQVYSLANASILIPPESFTGEVASPAPSETLGDGLVPKTAWMRGGW